MNHVKNALWKTLVKSLILSSVESYVSSISASSYFGYCLGMDSKLTHILTSAIKWRFWHQNKPPFPYLGWSLRQCLVVLQTEQSQFGIQCLWVWVHQITIYERMYSYEIYSLWPYDSYSMTGPTLSWVLLGWEEDRRVESGNLPQFRWGWFCDTWDLAQVQMIKNRHDPSLRARTFKSGNIKIAQ